MLIVEDGSGIVNANSYIEIEFADNFFGMQIEDKWSGLDLPTKQKIIIYCTDYIDTRWGSNFAGSVVNDEQGLLFPRRNCFTMQGRRLIGVPIEVRRACVRYAAAYLTLNTLTPELTTETREIISKSESLGVLSESVTYSTGSNIRSNFLSIPDADALIQSILSTSTAGINRRVIR